VKGKPAVLPAGQFDRRSERLDLQEPASDMRVMVEPAPLAGQTAALATLHGKERAIAPALRRIGLQVTVAAIDTDALGTFAGEIARIGSMRDVAVEKARRGARHLGLRYGLASEGTFGPDPDLPVVASGAELLALVDTATGRVITESLRTQTNFAWLPIAPGADLDGFLIRVGFPDHAVIARPHDDARAVPNEKGIRDRGALDAVLARLAGSGPLRIETDMRAHMNPTRMAGLATLADRLAARLATPCPACDAPGFGRIDVRRGLPCAACGTPTAMIAAELYGCDVCGQIEERARPDGLTQADPAQCPMCNP
jgi:hypothetical protein